MLHDVTVVRRKKVGLARVEAVPPEEFGISRRAKSIRDCGYCFHETATTEAELIADGFDEDSVSALPSSDLDTSEESLARDTVDDRDGTGSSNLNKATRIIKTTEHYILMDYEDEGKPCIYRVTTGGEGEDILYRDGKPAVDKVEAMPFAAMTPYIMTHRFFGRSVADMVMDLQRIKTALYRQALDNAYLANNQRTEIAESHATKNTIDDLLTNRPGGIVRTKTPGGLNVIPNQEIGSFVYPLIEYVDKQREWRTGVTRQGQGIGANDLQNIGEEAVLQFNSMAQARMRLVARIFAETGIRDLFLLLHNIIRSNATVADTVHLKNKWVEVDPREWRRRNDMTVTVGLGSGSKEQQGAFLMQMLAIQKEAMMAPGQPLVKWENIYATLKKLVQVGGLKSAEPYFTDPATVPPQPPQPDPKMVELEGKMKLEKVQAEADIATQKVKTEADTTLAQQRFALDRQLKLMDAAMRQQEFQQKQAADQAGRDADRSAKEAENLSKGLPTGNVIAQMMDMIRMMSDHMSAPTEVVRDPMTNRIVGARKVQPVQAVPVGGLQ